jgi:hypothetical protein
VIKPTNGSVNYTEPEVLTFAFGDVKLNLAPSVSKSRSEGKRRHLDGVNLIRATLKMRTLIKVLVLNELGFSNDVVRSFVMRNNRMNYLRTV